MKAKYNGPMSVQDFFQALLQDRHSFFNVHASGVQIKKAYLYITFCDEQGEPVKLRDQGGHIIEGYNSAGAYKSAADEYEARDIEPQIVSKVVKSAAPYASF